MPQTSAPPYRAERCALGQARDGRPIAVAPVTEAVADALGERIADIGPWRHYGFEAGRLAGGFRTAGDGAIRYQVLVDETLAGAMIIRSPWLAGPYLQMLALLPAFQNLAIGAVLLAWYEATARDGGLRQAWLCTTQVNIAAQRFYRAHGWELAAIIPGLMRDGDDELLLRKRFAVP